MKLGHLPRHSLVALLTTGALGACGADDSPGDGTPDRGLGRSEDNTVADAGSGGNQSGTSGTGAEGANTGSANPDAGAAPTADALELEFSPMYSAYNGAQTFKIPVRVAGVDGATFSASDPSMVDIQTTPDGAMITTLKAGQVTITASAEGRTGSALLTITEATQADWELGRDRYNNGIPAFAEDADGGMPGTGLPDPDSACTSCHGEGADEDIEHTPQQTGGYSDQELIDIFTLGMKPPGVPQRVVPLPGVWSLAHRWQMTEAEARGIVIYLRALEPRAQGEVDFGGLRGGGGISIGGGNGSADAGTSAAGQL